MLYIIIIVIINNKLNHPTVFGPASLSVSPHTAPLCFLKARSQSVREVWPRPNGSLASGTLFFGIWRWFLTFNRHSQLCSVSDETGAELNSPALWVVAAEEGDLQPEFLRSAVRASWRHALVEGLRGNRKCLPSHNRRWTNSENNEELQLRTFLSPCFLRRRPGL